MVLAVVFLFVQAPLLFAIDEDSLSDSPRSKSAQQLTTESPNVLSVDKLLELVCRSCSNFSKESPFISTCLNFEHEIFSNF